MDDKNNALLVGFSEERSSAWAVKLINMFYIISLKLPDLSDGKNSLKTLLEKIDIVFVNFNSNNSSKTNDFKAKVFCELLDDIDSGAWVVGVQKNSTSLNNVSRKSAIKGVDREIGDFVSESDIIAMIKEMIEDKEYVEITTKTKEGAP